MTGYKHGLSKTKIYGVWCAMMSRCYNPNSAAFPDYGGRGITVCEEWKDPVAFVAWAGKHLVDGLTLDRKDNDGNYEPNNCRGANKIEQARNRRSSVLYDWGGEKICLQEAASRAGLTPAAIIHRRKSGWPASELFSPRRR